MKTNSKKSVGESIEVNKKYILDLIKSISDVLNNIENGLKEGVK